MKEAIIQYNDTPSGGHLAISWKPLVRCENCKECYFASNRIPSEQTFVCGKHGINVTPDWFCADGEGENNGNEKG